MRFSDKPVSDKPGVTVQVNQQHLRRRHLYAALKRLKWHGALLRYSHSINLEYVPFRSRYHSKVCRYVLPAVHTYYKECALTTGRFPGSMCQSGVCAKLVQLLTLYTSPCEGEEKYGACG